jgi:adenylate kinase
MLLFGGPGVGKGTQGKLLRAVPGFRHLSTGDMFRGLDRTSDLGRLFDQISSKGELVSDELTVKLWAQDVARQEQEGDYLPGRDLLVLDGIPRSVAQCELMADKIDVLAIIHLRCEDKERMFARLRARALKENRADDAKDDVIRKRWDIYEAETAPVLGFYDRGLVHEVEAEGHPASVLLRVLEVGAPIIEAQFTNALG